MAVRLNRREPSRMKIYAAPAVTYTHRNEAKGRGQIRVIEDDHGVWLEMRLPTGTIVSHLSPSELHSLATGLAAADKAYTAQRLNAPRVVAS